MITGGGAGAMRSIRTLFMLGARRFFDDAEEWGLTRRGAVALALAPVLFTGVVALIAVLSLVMTSQFRPIFRFVTAEDSLLEWPQFMCLVGASAIFAQLG